MPVGTYTMDSNEKQSRDTIAAMLIGDGVNRGTLLRGLAVWLCAGIFFFGACALPRSGTRPKECTAALECDDDEPCTDETCNESGLCEYTVLSIDLPQAKGDCAELVCEEGKSVTLVTPGDLPVDENPCTEDLCGDDGPTNPAKADGTSCQQGGSSGICQDGECEVACDGSNAAERCDDDNACTTDSCDLSSGKCVNFPLDNVPVPGESQVAGDCKQLLCDNGKKETIELIDNSDVPFDGNDCTDDVCSEGIPSHPAKDAEVSCSDTGDPLAQVCNGSGQCVQCNSANQCGHLPTDDDCQTRTCSAQGVCGQDCAAADTPLNGTLQQDGDCQLAVCDGACGSKSNADNADVPNDNKECTNDICTNGSPSNTNKGANVSCGNKSICDGAGNCVGCLQPTDCNGTDTFCQARTCVNKVCGVDNTPNNTNLPDQNQTGGDCQELQCNGQGGTKSVAINDPFDDKNQCTTDTCNSGTPVNTNKNVNDSCSQNNGSFCDGNGSCVECNQASQCSGAPDCQIDICSMQNTCQFENEPLSTPAPSSYQTSGDCKLVVCDGNGAVSGTPQNQNIDLPVDGNDCTEDKCANGVPSNPDEAAGTSCVGGVCNGMGICAECVDDTTCPANKTCDVATFSCKLKQGQTCAVAADCITGQCADGLCCDTACAATCEHCALAASKGTCTAVPTGQDTGGDCPSGQACDGSKACKSEDGQSCSGGGDCLSSFCTDGVCCDNACGGTCERCNDGTVGQCEAVATGSDPDNECSGMDVCNGMGSCQCSDATKNGDESDVDCGGTVCAACVDGKICQSASDCQSGVCTGNVCVAPSCGDAVQNGTEVCDVNDPNTPCCNAACTGSKNSGEVCGTDPDGTDCDAAPTCDGAGSSTSNCQSNIEPNGTSCTDDGAHCTGAETCQSGVCTSAGDPCVGADGDNDCQESCDETNDNCLGNDPDGSPCPGMKSCMAGICN